MKITSTPAKSLNVLYSSEPIFKIPRPFIFLTYFIFLPITIQMTPKSNDSRHLDFTEVFRSLRIPLMNETLSKDADKNQTILLDLNNDTSSVFIEFEDFIDINNDTSSLNNSFDRPLNIVDSDESNSNKDLNLTNKTNSNVTNLEDIRETTAEYIYKTKSKNHYQSLSEDNTLQKLKIDDNTRKKIFFDYIKTIRKTISINENITTEGDLKTITDEKYLKNHTADAINATAMFENETLNCNNSDSCFNDTMSLSYNITDPILPESSTTVDLFKHQNNAAPQFLEEYPSTRTPKTTVSILGLFELTSKGAARAEGASELMAARLAVDHVNQRGVLPGYTLRLITDDTKCDPGVGVDRFFHALYTERESRMAMLLGSACSDVTESLAKIVPYWNIVQVSFGATSPALSDRNEFPLFCRTVAPDSSHNSARIAFIRQFGWDTVTAFSQNEEVYSLAVNELVTQLEANNITCAASITFAHTDFREQLMLLKELDTRIIIGSFSQEMMPKIFCEAHRLGMFGAQYAWLVSGAPPVIRSAPCARAQLAQAIEGLVMVDAHRALVGNVASLSGLTNEMFLKEMSNTGVSISTYAPQTYDAVWAIALTLSKAEKLWQDRNQTKTLRLELFDYDRKDMAEEFLNQLGNLSFLGVSGPVSFNGADRIGISAFYQIQEGRPRTIALYTNGKPVYCKHCGTAHWAGGIPVAKRVLVFRVDSVWIPARLAVSSLAACGVILALAFLAFNLHYSKQRSIKLSSPRLNNMTLVGCVLVYTAVALLGVDNAILPSFVPFSALCTARVYILSAGFSMAFGSMFAKTYRVHRIFISNRSGVCKTKLLQDTPLISLVCFLLIIDGMIVTLWASLDPMTRQLKNLTVELNPNDRSVVYQPQIEVCKSQNTVGWLCALYAYKGLFLIVGVYMAWETRNVKISALNDSKYIGISVYSVVITSISVVVIGTIISERVTIAYITISSLILITTTSTLCLLFLPKILAIRTKGEEDPVIQSMGLKLEYKTRRFVTDDTQELHFRIEIQNKVFRREVAALDKEIGRLEKVLSDPLESSTSSGSVNWRKTDLNTVEEERSRSDRRTPSITERLPLLLLSVLPPVIPRASWPSTDAFRGRNSISFSSQPKLDQRKSQPTIDLYNLCLNRRHTEDDNPGLLKRLKSFFGSRPSSRKTSTMSIADPTGQSIAAALKVHMGMLSGLMPGNRKSSMVVSCNTLDVPNLETRLRRQSFARSGPIIRVTDEEPVPGCSRFETELLTHKFVAEPGNKVNFVLPKTHGSSGSNEKIKGSPRFPHRISPTGSTLNTFSSDVKRNSADSVFTISNRTFDDQRRFHSIGGCEYDGPSIFGIQSKTSEDDSPDTVDSNQVESTKDPPD